MNGRRNIFTPEFSQLLLDFFNIAGLQVIFVMPYDSINIVL